VMCQFEPCQKFFTSRALVLGALPWASFSVECFGCRLLCVSVGGLALPPTPEPKSYCGSLRMITPEGMQRSRAFGKAAEPTLLRF